MSGFRVTTQDLELAICIDMMLQLIITFKLDRKSS